MCGREQGGQTFSASIDGGKVIYPTVANGQCYLTHADLTALKTLKGDHPAEDRVVLLARPLRADRVPGQRRDHGGHRPAPGPGAEHPHGRGAHRGHRLPRGPDPDRPARHRVRAAVAAPAAPGGGDRDPGHPAAAGQRRGHAARPGARRRPQHRGRPGGRGVQPDARPRRGGAGPPRRQRDPAAPVRRRRQPRAAHPAGRHPRLRRARAAPPGRRTAPISSTRCAGWSQNRSG